MVIVRELRMVFYGDSKGAKMVFYGESKGAQNGFL